MRARGIVLALLPVVVFAPLALAGVRPADVASTRTFLSAARTILTVEVNHGGAAKSSVNALIKHVASACPLALSPSARTGTRAQQATWTAITTTGSYELALAEFDTYHSAIRRELRRFQRLRWTVSSLNRALHVQVRGAKAILALQRPDLCAQTRTASTSDFSVIPSAISRFLRRVRTDLPEDNSQPTLGQLARQMERFTTADDAGEVATVRQLQRRLDNQRSSSFFYLNAWIRLVKALSGV